MSPKPHSVYPSLTFPNHYSLVTGLKPENHGIVSNKFWDPKRKKKYKYGRPMTLDGSWYGGEPIWVAASKQGMLSATCFWVGSDANIQGYYPTYFYFYNAKFPNHKRVKQVIDWLKLPSKNRPHFITLYFSDVDGAGHDYSPNSKEVHQAILRVDRSLKVLFQAVEKMNLPINIIVVSDHGMQTYTHYLYLDDFISLKDLRVIGRGGHALIYTNNTQRKETIYRKLKKVNSLKVYKQKELPKSYGYSHNPRIGDLILSVKPGYYLYHTRRPKRLKRLKRLRSKKRGAHGYDPKNNVYMNGVFFARGPQIKPLGEIPSFENIHIYPLIMDILRLEIRTPIDGKREVLSKKLLYNITKRP